MFGKNKKSLKGAEEDIKGQDNGGKDEGMSKYVKEEVMKPEEKIDPEDTSVEDLYPFGAPNYDVTASPEDAYCLCDHASKCPVCGANITLQMPLTSRLTLKSVDKDFRRHFKEFEPVWYDIWCCPECYYTALYTQFEESRSFEAKKIKRAMQPYKEAGVLNFSVPRNVNEVITAMCLALRCSDYYDGALASKAKIMLHLAWIYKDLGEEELYMKASAKALERYQRMYYETREDFDPLVEQMCFLVMAELNILQKDYESAYNCLVHSRKIEGGNRLYRMDAQNRIEEVKEMREASK